MASTDYVDLARQRRLLILFAVPAIVGNSITMRETDNDAGDLARLHYGKQEETNGPCVPAGEMAIDSSKCLPMSHTGPA